MSHQSHQSHQFSSTPGHITVGVFSTKPYDESSLREAHEQYKKHQHAHQGGVTEVQLEYLSASLGPHNAHIADQFDAISVFVEDVINKQVLSQLKRVKLIALRAAGTDKIDINAAKEKGIQVTTCPSYSPESVAEHAVALMMALARRIPRAYIHSKERNFDTTQLVGFTFRGKTVGVVGTGRIGQFTARILLGMGCKVLAFDVHKNTQLEQLGVRYVELKELLSLSDIVSLHAPLTKDTKHLINQQSIQHMKPGVMLINTSRGALLDTDAVLAGLRSGTIGYLGIDVYEYEEGVFFADHGTDVMLSDEGRLAQLVFQPNVLVTGHQAFLTREALSAIAHTTIHNIYQFFSSNSNSNSTSSTGSATSARVASHGHSSNSHTRASSSHSSAAAGLPNHAPPINPARSAPSAKL